MSYTFELNNYSDKVQLIDNVVVDDNRKAMLTLLVVK